MKKFIILSIILAITIALLFPAFALGDDVDFGGGDTGGGWDGGGGGNWDAGDDDWGNDSDAWDSGNGGGGMPMPLPIPIGSDSDSGIDLGTIVIVFILIVIIAYFMSKKGVGGQAQRPMGPTRRIDEASLQALMQQDPGFSAADIESKVKNWVMQFETAWAGGDMTPCRPFISDGLYNTYQMQIDMMKKNGELSRTEDLAVMACSVEKWTQDGNNEYLDVWLQEKKRTYKVDINDPQKVVKGDKQTTYILEYRWQLIRSVGAKTENAGVRVMECPNCGAQTSVNQSGKCEYCGSTLVAESFDWVLNKADKLAQTSHR